MTTHYDIIPDIHADIDHLTQTLLSRRPRGLGTSGGTDRALAAVFAVNTRINTHRAARSMATKR